MNLCSHSTTMVFAWPQSLYLLIVFGLALRRTSEAPPRDLRWNRNLYMEELWTAVYTSERMKPHQINDRNTNGNIITINLHLKPVFAPANWLFSIHAPFLFLCHTDQICWAALRTACSRDGRLSKLRWKTMRNVTRKPTKQKRTDSLRYHIKSVTARTTEGKWKSWCNTSTWFCVKMENCAGTHTANDAEESTNALWRSRWSVSDGPNQAAVIQHNLLVMKQSAMMRRWPDLWFCHSLRRSERMENLQGICVALAFLITANINISDVKSSPKYNQF